MGVASPSHTRLLGGKLHPARLSKRNTAAGPAGPCNAGGRLGNSVSVQTPATCGPGLSQPEGLLGHDAFCVNAGTVRPNGEVGHPTHRSRAQAGGVQVPRGDVPVRTGQRPGSTMRGHAPRPRGVPEARRLGPCRCPLRGSRREAASSAATPDDYAVSRHDRVVEDRRALCSRWQGAGATRLGGNVTLAPR